MFVFVCVCLMLCIIYRYEDTRTRAFLEREVKNVLLVETYESSFTNTCARSASTFFFFFFCSCVEAMHA